jgi:hypothetical protein
MKRACCLLFLSWLVLSPLAGAQEAGPHDGNRSPGFECPYKYIGNSFSHVFHRPSCPFAKKIWPSRIELFHYRRQAIDNLYSPCHYCLPPVWLEVHAVLLTRQLQSDPVVEKTPAPLP